LEHRRRRIDPPRRRIDPTAVDSTSAAADWSSGTAGFDLRCRLFEVRHRRIDLCCRRFELRGRRIDALTLPERAARRSKAGSGKGSKQSFNRGRGEERQAGEARRPAAKDPSRLEVAHKRSGGGVPWSKGRTGTRAVEQTGMGCGERKLLCACARAELETDGWQSMEWFGCWTGHW